MLGMNMIGGVVYFSPLWRLSFVFVYFRSNYMFYIFGSLFYQLHNPKAVLMLLHSNEPKR